MKLLSLDLNLEGIEIDQPSQEIGPKKIMQRMITHFFTAYSNDHKGLNYEEQRYYNKIMDKIDEAIKDNKTEVEIDDTWFELIEKAKKCAKFPPSQLIVRVYDVLEKTK